MNVFQTGEFEKVGFIHMESLSLFSWSGLRTSVSISLSNQGPGQLNLMSKHPWCTYKFGILRLTIQRKRAKYISKRATEAKLELRFPVNQ